MSTYLTDHSFLCIVLYERAVNMQNLKDPIDYGTWSLMPRPRVYFNKNDWMDSHIELLKK